MSHSKYDMFMSLVIAPFGVEELAVYVTRQVDHLFPHSGTDDAAIVSAAMGKILPPFDGPT